MNKRQEFEHRWKKAKRLQHIGIWIWLALCIMGCLLFGRVEHHLERWLGVSYNTTVGATGIALLAVWTLPPLLFFQWRARAGLICSHCGTFRTPFSFPTFALLNGRCPRCKTQVFEIGGDCKEVNLTRQS